LTRRSGTGGLTPSINNISAKAKFIVLASLDLSTFLQPGTYPKSSNISLIPIAVRLVLNLSSRSWTMVYYFALRSLH
jgi:hypothetical protein